MEQVMFWSSADLTGNQTFTVSVSDDYWFWSSADLTGNQTADRSTYGTSSFGAVPI